MVCVLDVVVAEHRRHHSSSRSYGDPAGATISPEATQVQGASTAPFAAGRRQYAAVSPEPGSRARFDGSPERSYGQQEDPMRLIAAFAVVLGVPAALAVLLYA